MDRDYDAYLEALAQRESSGIVNRVNTRGSLGLYQMEELALIDAGYYRPDGTSRNDWRGQWTGKDGIHSQEDFLSSEAGQRAAIDAYNRVQWGYIRHFGLDAYVGQSIGGVTVTEAGMLAGAHLVGIGNLRSFLRSGGTVVPRDGNRTPITEYFQLLGGYDVSAVSGGGGSGPAPLPPIPGTGGGESPGGEPTGGGVPFPSGGGLTSGVVMDPAEAFDHGSGLAPGMLNALVVSVLLAGLLIWSAWMFRFQWQAVTIRRASFGSFLFTALRVLVVLSLLTYLLTT